MRRHALAPLALLLAAAPLGAQSAPASIPEGARVRLTSANARGVFTVVRATAETLTVARGATAPVAIPFRDVQRLDQSLGRRSTAAGRRRGLLTGLGVGGAVGAVLGAVTETESLSQYTKADAARDGGIVGAMAGGLIGRARGAKHPGERWESVPLVQRVGVAPGPGARLAVRVSGSF
jgi:hypothetical protein